MTTIITDAALYRLLAWLSPSYPVGGYSYSHGLEWAVEQGLVRDRAGLVEWIGGVLARGTGRVDGALFAAAWRAMQAGDSAALDALVELASAWRGTAETALEGRAQGAAFLVVTRSAWPNARLDALADRHKGLAPLPVAVGAASAVHAVPLPAALSAYLAAFAANLVSAGVRLIPLGQTDGQAAVAALEPAVGSAAAAGLVADLDALGTATPMVDWCSMRHETQYTRLFRS